MKCALSNHLHSNALYLIAVLKTLADFFNLRDDKLTQLPILCNIIFFYFLQIYNLLYKLSNKQICYKETLVRSNRPMMILLCILYATLLPLSGTLVRSNRPMMILLCILYATLLPLSGPVSQRAIAVLVCV
jgi:hypothetical protein